MNYHIMGDANIIDGFIEDIYTLGEQDNHTFLIRNDEQSRRHVKTSRPVRWIGSSNEENSRHLAAVIQPTDNIFVHWFDLKVAEVVLGLPGFNKLFVMLWGGDFFEDPFWNHASWVHDPKTYALLSDLKKPRVRARRNPLMMYKQWKEARRFESELIQQVALKHQQVAAIDYLLVGEMNHADYLKVRSLYPGCRAGHLPFFYDTHFDQAGTLPVKQRKPGERIRIMLGNSATWSNNHLDAFDLLKTLDNIEIHCPLSYGKDVYGKIIEEAGREIFGDRFFPLTSYMSREDYLRYLNDMDIVVMYHNRSQAWGNISTSLALGKPVFLKPENTLFSSAQVVGVKIHDVRTIGELDLESLIHESAQMRETNRQRLMASISSEKRLADLSHILKNFAQC